jgi:dTDP-4-amino-4,6-dideoxygalactose transaminase
MATFARAEDAATLPTFDSPPALTAVSAFSASSLSFLTEKTTILRFCLCGITQPSSGKPGMSRATIPFLALDREFAADREAYMSIVERVLSRGQVLQGPEVELLETKIAEQCGRRHAIAVGSCTDALFFALTAAGLKAGDEVLVTDFSFIASASSIVRTGATPVFVDITDDYRLDLNDAHRRITAKTRALLYVHLFGHMGPPAEIQAFCDEHNLVLIEDAAQAFGAQRDHVRAGSMGLASCLSFDPTKVIGAPGSGGMILTDDSDVFQQTRHLRYHGKLSTGSYATLGYNSQMPSLTAAVLLFKLDQNPAWLARRKEIAKYYDAHLPNEVQRPTPHPSSTHIYHKYVIRCDHRDDLASHLAGRGVATRVHYQTPLHEEPLFARGGVCGDFPHTIRATRQVLSLPIHAFMTETEVRTIVNAIPGRPTGPA